MGRSFLTACVVTVLFLTGCGGRPTFDTEAAFDRVVYGKNKTEVMKALGKPDIRYSNGRLMNGNTYDDCWGYDNMVKDPVTGKWAHMKVMFKGEQVLQTLVD
jgi:hypothetical protein